MAETCVMIKNSGNAYKYTYFVHVLSLIIFFLATRFTLMQSVLVIIIARLAIAAILPQSNLHAKSSIVAARDCVAILPQY